MMGEVGGQERRRKEEEGRNQTKGRGQRAV